MYSKIINPETGRAVNINSKLGLRIYNNYTQSNRNNMSGGGSCGCCGAVGKTFKTCPDNPANRGANPKSKKLHTRGTESGKRCASPKSNKLSADKKKLAPRVDAEDATEETEGVRRETKCVDSIKLYVNKYDNYKLNGTYKKCLEFSGRGNSFKEVDPKLGFRSEYVTEQQEKKFTSIWNIKLNKERARHAVAGEDDELAWWASSRLAHDQAMREAAEESIKEAMSSGNWKFDAKWAPSRRTGPGGCSMLVKDLSTVSCVYCKVDEPNKVIYQKNDNVWYIQDLHHTGECNGLWDSMSSRYWYKPREGAWGGWDHERDALFHANSTSGDGKNPPESGWKIKNGECIKDPASLKVAINAAHDKNDIRVAESLKPGSENSPKVRSAIKSLLNKARKAAWDDWREENKSFNDTGRGAKGFTLTLGGSKAARKSDKEVEMRVDKGHRLHLAKIKARKASAARKLAAKAVSVRKASATRRAAVVSSRKASAARKAAAARKGTPKVSRTVTKDHRKPVPKSVNTGCPDDSRVWLSSQTPSTVKKYKSRKSPALPGGECCGETRKGQNSNNWTSVPRGKSCAWAENK